MPQVCKFYPDGELSSEPILLTLDEYEVIRLVDLEERTHEQCAAQMDVSRSTVQEIYESARRKLAACLVHGRQLVIKGGNYRICDGHENCCCNTCMRRIALKGYEVPINTITKGDNNMKIAVTYDNGQVFQHFGHTEQFKLYSISDGKITSSEIVFTNGSGHGALAGFLMQHGVDTLICGGIGGGAQMALMRAGIKFYGGVSGSADEAVEKLLNGQLIYNPNVQCNHHNHEHNCGEHGCGTHNCH